MEGYFAIIGEQLGIPPFLLVVLFIWTFVWKMLALWKAARNSHVVWFIIIAIFNTVGILPILYIFLFSKISKPSKETIKSSEKPKTNSRKRIKRK